MINRSLRGERENEQKRVSVESGEVIQQKEWNIRRSEERAWTDRGLIRVTSEESCGCSDSYYTALL